MLRTIGTVEERRTSESIDSLDRRLTPRRQYIEVDFGSSPATSATARLGGFTWITLDHCAVIGLTTAAQATAGLRAAVTLIDPGKAIEVSAVASSALTGVQRLSLVAL